MNIPVFDLHCDTALELVDKKGSVVRRLAKGNGHIDLERGRKLPGYAQFFAFFTYPGMAEPGALPVEARFRAALDNFFQELKENQSVVEQAFTARDAERITASGKIAAFLSMEGPAGISFDPGRLEDLAELGFRMTTLGWNEQNPLAGSHVTGGGLTAQGREFVMRAQANKMLIDVSHLSDEGFWDLMDMTQGPVVASHSNSRWVYAQSRNLTDEQFKAICQTGGVAGLNLYTGFIGDDPTTLDKACDHVLHFLELGGEKHIALGGDLDGCESLPNGFDGVDSYPKLAQALLARDVGEKTVQDIFWNNAARLF